MRHEPVTAPINLEGAAMNDIFAMVLDMRPATGWLRLQGSDKKMHPADE